MAIAYTVAGLGICQEDMGPIPRNNSTELNSVRSGQRGPLSFESRTQYPPPQPVRLLGGVTIQAIREEHAHLGVPECALLLDGFFDNDLST